MRKQNTAGSRAQHPEVWKLIYARFTRHGRDA
jgi:hypothetical protein